MEQVWLKQTSSNSPSVTFELYAKNTTFCNLVESIFNAAKSHSNTVYPDSSKALYVLFPVTLSYALLVGVVVCILYNFYNKLNLLIFSYSNFCP